MSASGAIVSGLHATIHGHETKATAVQMDFDANGNVIFYGISEPGADINSTIWQIKKLVYSGTGNLLSVLWANGKSDFSNAWSARAGLAYS